MILFFNFAPIEFMGGAEKWMLETAKKINKKEKTELLSVSPRIANIYARLVLKRNFDKRADHIGHPNKKITPKSLITYSKDWKKVRKIFADARIIYCKYEVLELSLIFFFLGFSGLRKTVGGMHSPLIYASPKSFFDYLHNFIYSSVFNKLVLMNIKKVHVLNLRDKKFLTDKLNLKKVFYVPNGAPPVHEDTNPIGFDPDKLRVLFVGELSERKGVDVLLKIIGRLPMDIILTVVGDGPMENEIWISSRRVINIKYKKHVEHEKMNAIYQKNDVLLLPSRAESMPLVVLEALSNGLMIVDSSDVSLGFKNDIERKVDGYDPDQYISTLYEILNEKKQGTRNRANIKSFFESNFNVKKTVDELYENAFAD